MRSGEHGRELAASRPALEHLRLLVEAQPDYAIFLLDTEGHVATWNEGARRIKGYEPSEIIGEHFSRFYLQKDLDEGLPAHELEVATATGRFEHEGWRVRKDGSRFWANVVITAVRDERDRLIGFGKVTRDLTSRLLAEQRLRTSAADLIAANERLKQFRLLVASVRDYAIFLLDPGGHIRSWNAGARQIKGYTEEEVLGRHFELFYTEEDRARSHPADELEIATREGRFEEEGWRVRKDGTQFWANVVVTALRDDAGDLVGFAKVTRDLSERRAAEMQLRETAAELGRSNAELEHFASIAAHDLTDPLHTMVGLSDLLVRRYGDALGEDGRAIVGEIAAGGERLRALVDALLSYARASQQPLEPQRVAVAAALRRVLRALHSRVEESGAIVGFEPEALPEVSADPEALELVLQNLLVNAMKFTRPGEAPQVEVSAEKIEGAWRIVVSDRGLGVPEEERKRIFRSFERAHPHELVDGSGLGLALAQRLVARHGGAMGVEPAAEGGSRFWFTLPDGAAGGDEQAD